MRSLRKDSESKGVSAMGWNYIASPTKDASKYAISAKLILPLRRAFEALKFFAPLTPGLRKTLICTANALSKKRYPKSAIQKALSERPYTKGAIQKGLYKRGYTKGAIQKALSNAP